MYVFDMSEETIKCLSLNVSKNIYPIHYYKYLSKFPELISIEKLWKEMDRVWLDCLQKHEFKLTENFFAEFYSHPIWCLNSIFSSIDSASRQNRKALIQAISSLQVETVVDMGGGYGVFLEMLKKECSKLKLILCEPYLDKQIELELSKKKIFSSREIPLSADVYVFIDVLEHIVEPLSYLQRVIKSAKINSYFIFGNCFYPCIKCHLPSTFYLRHTFHLAALLMGLSYVDKVKDAPYMKIYQLTSRSSFDLKKVKIITKITSLLITPCIFGIKLLSKLKKIIKIN